MHTRLGLICRPMESTTSKHDSVRSSCAVASRSPPALHPSDFHLPHTGASRDKAREAMVLESSERPCSRRVNRASQRRVERASQCPVVGERRRSRAIGVPSLKYILTERRSQLGQGLAFWIHPPRDIYFDQSHTSAKDSPAQRYSLRPKSYSTSTQHRPRLTSNRPTPARREHNGTIHHGTGHHVTVT